MLALRLADEAAKSRRERGGVSCPWEIEETDINRLDHVTGVDRSSKAVSDGAGQVGRSELDHIEDRVDPAGPNGASTIIQDETPCTSRDELFRERVHTVFFPQIDRPLRTGRRRETGFPGPVTMQTISHTVDQLIAQERTIASQGYFHTPQELLGLPEVTKKPTGPWGFDEALVKRFPALRKRNFVCVQEHQATGRSVR
jgi:hypothetical protein